MPDNLSQILAIALYFGVLVVIGVIATRRTRNIKDYYAGGKRLGFINVAFSARATGESAWLLLGLTGMGFATGYMALWVVVGELIGVGGAWIFMSRRFKRLTDRYDSLTVPDYFESRFRDGTHLLRLIAALSLCIFVPIYAGAQVFATGQAFYDFLGWDHFLGATIGFLVVLAYITSGGFIAVVWSDVFQGLLMVAGLVALPLVLLAEAGGLPAIHDALRQNAPHMLSHTSGEGWTTMTIMTIVGFAAIGIGFLGSPQVFVRFISLKNEKQILPGTLTALTWTLLADTGAVLVGVFGRAVFSLDEIGGSSEDILPHAATTLLPAFFAGVFIAMVLSAIMSTIDSLLVVASSAAVRDYWQKAQHPNMPDDQLFRLSRVITFVLAIVAFGIGIGILAYDKERGVFWTIIFGWSGIAATFCPVMILSLFWSGLTRLGAAVSMITGFLCVPIFKFVMPPIFDAAGWELGPAYLEKLDVLAPSFTIAMTLAIVVSLLDRKGRERLADVRDELRDASGRNGP